MNYGKLQDTFDGARWVQFDGYRIFVWRGGHGIHVHDAHTLQEIDYYSVGDFAKNEATLEEVQDGIKDILTGN